MADYRRALNLNDAIASISYRSGGTGYHREYFTSHPDEVLVVRLRADRPGALSLTVRPEIPYLESRNERDSKSGTVTATGETITLAGTIDFFQLNYEIQVRVLQQGGKLMTGSETIDIQHADAVTLIVAIDTNYDLSSRVFLNEPPEKLDASLNPHNRVSEKIEQPVALGFVFFKQPAQPFDHFRVLAMEICCFPGIGFKVIKLDRWEVFPFFLVSRYRWTAGEFSVRYGSFPYCHSG